MKKNIIYILITSTLLIACSDKKTAEQEVLAEESASQEIVLTQNQLNNIDLSYVNMEQKGIGAIIKANGTIDVPPESMVSISAPMGGNLKYTRLLPGLKVKKGEVLAIVEDQQFVELGREFLTTKNKVELSKIDFQKQKELYAQKAISEKAYLEAKSSLEILDINLQSLSEKLKLIGIDANKLSVDKISSKVNILSPINGYVSKVNVNVGKYLSPNDILFELINPDDIHLNIQIFQRDIPNLTIGQNVITYTNEHPEVKYKADIILIGRGLNENKAVDVHCHFEKPDHDLIPGMFMNVEIESSIKKTWVVKESSVLQFENANYLVLAKNDSTFELLAVKTGIKEKEDIEIIDANEELKNAKIVGNGAYKILMAMKNKSEE
jgi:cobalt-zinc-cadmium efflux system membrane fusion protein